MIAQIALDQRIVAETDRLVAEFGELVGEDSVRRLVEDLATSFREPKVTDFVPLFISRFVREQLKGVTANVEE